MKDLKKPLARLLLACSLSLAGPALVAQSLPADLKDFEIAMDFSVTVDGHEQPSIRLYQSFQPPAFLVAGPSLASAAVLVPGGYQVASLDLSHLQVDPMGAARVTPGYVLGPIQGTFRVGSGQQVEFNFNNQSIRLAPKAWLLGMQDAKSIGAYDQIYRARSLHYRPDPQVLAQLKKIGDDVRVTVYFGSWCRHCQTHVPSFMRLESLLAGSPVRFEYYGVPRGQPDPDMPPEVKRLPTAIVHVGGRRVGLFTDHDVEAPEVGLSKVLAGR